MVSLWLLSLLLQGRYFSFFLPPKEMLTFEKYILNVNNYV